jgi:hypothetical protein
METKQPRKPYRILIKFPTRNRPQKFIQAIKEMYVGIGDKANTKIVVTADIDDPTMYNKETLQAVHPFIINYGLEIEFGKSESKIDAVNRDLEKYKDWDIIVVMSDDMKWTTQSFDYQIRKNFETFFPDTDGIMHYNDGFAGDRLITMPIMGRKYFDRFGYIYHPSYKSLWCDNEMTDVVRQLGKVAYIDQSIFRHEHYHNIGGHMDEQLKHTESFSARDKDNYEMRKHNNFPVDV